MLSSTIIPTVGRPTLTRAVESVLTQPLVESSAHEVVVVNDSGERLQPQPWMNAPNVRVMDTMRHERSVARNTGAAVARGTYLHFLDDDDWLAPGGLVALLARALAENAAWVYGATQLVDRSGKPLIVLRHNYEGNAALQAIAGEWFPLQSALIRADVFFQVGGFNALLAGPEDIDLARRILLQESIVYTHQIVAVVGMGSANSTTDYGRQAEKSRAAREIILRQPDIRRRLQAGVTDSQWQGRLTRVYTTSAIWNFQRRRGFTSASRLTSTVASLRYRPADLFDRGFWQGLTKAYASETFARGFRERDQADPLLAPRV